MYRIAISILAITALAWVVFFVMVNYRQTDPHRKSILVNGTVRNYLFYEPEQIEEELPLLLVFHGFSGDAARIRISSKLHELVNEHKFFLAYLDGDPTWRRPVPGRDCVDIDFFDQLCDELKRDYSIDSSRIYVAGLSMGGDFAIRLAGFRSDRIAAVVSQGMITEEAVESERPFPLLIILGTKDDRVPSETISTVPDSFRDRGHEVKVIRPKNVGHWWHVPLNEELWSFLSKHRLENSR